MRREKALSLSGCTGRTIPNRAQVKAEGVADEVGIAGGGLNLGVAKRFPIVGNVTPERQRARQTRTDHVWVVERIEAAGEHLVQLVFNIPCAPIVSP